MRVNISIVTITRARWKWAAVSIHYVWLITHSVRITPHSFPPPRKGSPHPFLSPLICLFFQFYSFFSFFSAAWRLVGPTSLWQTFGPKDFPFILAEKLVQILFCNHDTITPAKHTFSKLKNWRSLLGIPCYVSGPSEWVRQYANTATVATLPITAVQSSSHGAMWSHRNYGNWVQLTTTKNLKHVPSWTMHNVYIVQFFFPLDRTRSDIS